MMKEGYHIKPSRDLYDNSPSLWMFRPYYVAVLKKEEMAGVVLERELNKHYMKQDGDVVNTQYKAKNFNMKLRDEMDAVVRNMGIIDADKMWEEMDAATTKILNKYTGMEDTLWLKFLRKIKMIMR
jgi:hypothetical protein